MKFLSRVGLGLSVVFGCLVLALVGELYYLLWWKKRSAHRSIEEGYCISSSTPAKELFQIFCLKKPSQLTPQSLALTQQDAYTPVPGLNASGNRQSVQSSESCDSDGKDLSAKQEQETMETELMRLHKLSGLPRFLFTIVEETKEDLMDSEDGRSMKGSRGKSLSDLLVAVETPYLTPVASPSLFTPPLTPVESGYRQNGFNPLFECMSDAEFNRVRASPPPMFKFLQDAEEKLRRKMRVEENQSPHDQDSQESIISNHSSEPVKEDEDGSFIPIVVDTNRGRREHYCRHDHHCSEAS